MYVGRFAPTPSGPLHFGSIVTAVGSYCDAKSRNGKWIVRIDDLDQARTVRGADSDILYMLDSYALHWDGRAIYQSRQRYVYESWRHKLKEELDIYPCVCSRKKIREHSTLQNEEWIYSGYCKTHSTKNKIIRSYRINLRQGCTVAIDDAVLGSITDDLNKSSGDFVLFKPDGTVSQHLANVLDDHHSGITHIVRGEDLLLSSLRQSEIRRILGHNNPKFLHLPLVRNKAGQKLSKQNKAEPIKSELASSTLFDALTFLSQSPPIELQREKPSDIMIWAVGNWKIPNVFSKKTNTKDAAVTQSTRNQVD
ncbi:tRNA glutamyl-Q(34) synthetase GluQRS [Burkholderiales bacterium]|nr:tRNA glutamyl-Q(34) synthetase GluQRS [Burkholderiales bacterium]